MKEQRLSQLLAARDTVKSHTNPRFTELQKMVKRPELFQGMSKTYQKQKEDSDDQPPESVRVQKRVDDVLDDLRKLCSEQFDAVASVDVGNCSAKADVVVDEKVLLKDCPVTFLLSLEKDLKQVRSLLDDLPVLDPAHKWSLDASAGLFKTEEFRTNRTNKVQKSLVLLEPTEKHPGQAQMITVDETVGQWVTSAASGATTVDKKKQLLEKCDKLINAVQAAREEANSVKTTSVQVGKAVFDFLLE